MRSSKQPLKPIQKKEHDRIGGHLGEEDPSPSKLPAKSTHWKNTRVIKSSWLNVEKEEEPVFDLNFSRIPDVESFLLKRQAVSHLNSVRGGDMAYYLSKE